MSVGQGMQKRVAEKKRGVSTGEGVYKRGPISGRAHLKIRMMGVQAGPKSLGTAQGVRGSSS